MRLQTSWMAIATFVLAAAPMAGCSDAVDNTPIEESRDSRVSNLAEDACDQYATCKGYGAGKTYTTETECRAAFEGRARDLWSDESCGRGQINDTRYDACVESAKTVACDSDIITALAALSDCNSEKVCIDPPR